MPYFGYSLYPMKVRTRSIIRLASSAFCPPSGEARKRSSSSCSFVHASCRPCSKRCSPAPGSKFLMLPRIHAHILVTSSAASFQPLPGLATHGATKAFLTSFAQALDAELRPMASSVSCLAPGYTVKGRGAARPRPRWLWTTSEEVARRAVDRLFAVRPLIVPGVPWKVVAAVAPRMPRILVRQLAAGVGRRMLDQ